MKLIISIIILIIMMIILYSFSYWIYKYYKNDKEEIKNEILGLEKRMCEYQRKNEINIQLINWLYDEVTRKDNTRKKKND